MPTSDILVSACMIVRNEAHFLEGCLLSIQDAVDEIVIGDTGSTDRTVEIARDLGARVYDIPWGDDFSAARNQVLQQAKGNWILSIDADERLRPIPRAQIEPFLKTPLNIAYYVLIYPKTGWTGMWVVRLFRNDPRIRFKGIFHETLWDGLQEAGANNSKNIGFSELVLDHLGYDNDQRAKRTRNLSLLLKEIDRDPGNAYAWTHLGLIYEELGSDAQAESAWQTAIDIVRNKQDVCVHEIYGYIYYIEWRLRQGQPVQALLKEVMDYAPDNPHLYWLKGRLLMNENRYHDALPLFKSLISWGQNRDFDRLSVCYETCIFAVKAYDSLATCYFRLRNYAESRKYFALAEKSAPNPLEYKVKRQLCEAMMDHK